MTDVKGVADQELLDEVSLDWEEVVDVVEDEEVVGLRLIATGTG